MADVCVLIIEDEDRAADRLRKMLEEWREDIILPEAPDSVEDALNWLRSNPAPHIILMDIELADGKSFRIFQEHEVKSKVIFTTAFDQYAMEAFKHEGIAYLLKPIKKEELFRTLDKALKTAPASIDYDKLAEAVEKRHHRYPRRILVRLGQRYKAIPVEEIAYIFIDSKTVLAMTTEGKDIPLDQTLEQLEGMLDPDKFFRINRKFIVSAHALDNMYAWSRARMKIQLKPPVDQEVIVATERAHDFKEWLEGRK